MGPALKTMCGVCRSWGGNVQGQNRGVFHHFRLKGQVRAVVMLHQRLQGGQLFPTFHKADGPAANDALSSAGHTCRRLPRRLRCRGSQLQSSHWGQRAAGPAWCQRGHNTEIQRQALRPGGHTKVQRNKVRHAGCRIVHGNAADGALFQNGKLALTGPPLHDPYGALRFLLCGKIGNALLGSGFYQVCQLLQCTKLAHSAQVVVEFQHRRLASRYRHGSPAHRFRR